MKHVVERLLGDALSSLQKSGELPNDLSTKIKVVRTNYVAHGDYASNLALVLAKPCCQSPHKIAELLVQKIPFDAAIEKIEIAPLGFINFFLCNSFSTEIIAEILIGAQQSNIYHKQRIMNEFISAGAASDNSLYSIQYAHARIYSLLRQLKDRAIVWNRETGLKYLNLLVQPYETQLISLLNHYPEKVGLEIVHYPQVTDYLREVANGLHNYYNVISLLCEQEQLRCARLCLLEAVRQVLNNGLNLLGLSAFESIE
jgi:arginyl-tRNA synthetase